MKKIEELKSDEIEELIKDYQSPSSVITVAKIIEKYDLDVKPNNISASLPAQITDEKCPYCNVRMFAKIKNRHDMDVAFCPVCGHENHEGDWTFFRKPFCKCVNCSAKWISILEEKKEIIRQNYSCNYKKTNFNDLSLIDKFHLVNVILLGGGKISGFFLGRNYKYVATNVSDLRNKGYISISPESPINAFCEDDFPNKYYPSEVKYDVNVVFTNDELSEINEVSFWENVNATPQEKYELFIDIMHKDVLRRFEYMMNERGMDLEIPSKAEDSLKDLYEKLSYGQIMNLCYNVARFYLDKTRTGKIYKSVAAKAALKTVSTFYKNNKEKGWEINNSEVSYAGKELIFFVENIMKKDIRILREVITVNDME